MFTQKVSFSRPALFASLAALLLAACGDDGEPAVSANPSASVSGTATAGASASAASSASVRPTATTRPSSSPSSSPVDSGGGEGDSAAPPVGDGSTPPVETDAGDVADGATPVQSDASDDVDASVDEDASTDASGPAPCGAESEACCASFGGMGGGMGGMGGGQPTCDVGLTCTDDVCVAEDSGTPAGDGGECAPAEVGEECGPQIQGCRRCNGETIRCQDGMCVDTDRDN